MRSILASNRCRSTRKARSRRQNPVRCGREIGQQPAEMRALGPIWGQRPFLLSIRSLLLAAKYLIYLAGVAGLEPATPGFGDRCSTN
jgi:hypothetical protein